MNLSDECIVDSDCEPGQICLGGGTSASTNFCAPEGIMPHHDLFFYFLNFI